MPVCAGMSGVAAVGTGHRAWVAAGTAGTGRLVGAGSGSAGGADDTGGVGGTEGAGRADTAGWTGGAQVGPVTRQNLPARSGDPGKSHSIGSQGKAIRQNRRGRSGGGAAMRSVCGPRRRTRGGKAIRSSSGGGGHLREYPIAHGGNSATTHSMWCHPMR
ncbi:hypothetical protein Aglo01_23910 [Actinokineospora globicatena]|nr:hypothetical protein Aglo01_23910 [Actinokineospora globicatena]GLW85424.1 hypothetical protein Aglo02_30640 [Actinokineospora globicatena]